METVDCVVVGAGVIGLSVARALAQSGLEVLILEQSTSIGSGVSSRNSEVIHAGIYYEPGSLKSRLCVEGKEQLYAYCRERHIPHSQLGKLIVATSHDQTAQIHSIMANARACDVNDLYLISRDEARRLEPHLECISAIVSPSTGIIDSHAFMLSLLGDAEAAGAILVMNTEVVGGTIDRTGVNLNARDVDSNIYSLRTRLLVNCAALGAQGLAARLDGFPADRIPPLQLARGCYFTLTAGSPFSRLIYPIPEDGGLGIHLTLDLGRQAKFGPDVEWIDTVDFTVDPDRAASFYARIRTYWPDLRDGCLQPAYAGVRPKVSGPGEPAADFVIQGPSDHGICSVVNLFGIESPGLTSALAIANKVEGLARSIQRTATGQ